MLTTIDLNADVGESLYDHHVGEDDALIPLLSSANIACGFHGGDPETMLRALELAIQHGVRIGAHPSYDDRATASAVTASGTGAAAVGSASFGREERGASPAAIAAQLEVQLATLKALAEARGGRVAHVKLHGALYHRVSRDPAAAAAALGAVRKLLPPAVIVAQAGSAFAAAARAAGFGVRAEAFADRGYLADGSLVPRGQPGAILADPGAIARQALAIARDRAVPTADGRAAVAVSADTICLHGDHPGAAAAAREIRRALGAAGIAIG